MLSVALAGATRRPAAQDNIRCRLMHADRAGKWIRYSLASAWLLATVLTQPALAWNAAGHRLSASIAWQQLDPNTRQKLVRLLAQHPDYPLWLSRSQGGDPAESAAFLEASTWPDDIKKDARFYDAGDDKPSLPLPGFPDRQRHRDWHYINLALGHPAKLHGSSGQLDKRLDLLASLVGDSKADDRQRAYALPWLIHLTADVHQPLHVVSRYDAKGRSDEGGNRLFIEHPFHPRRSSMSLHAYWDDLPGAPWLRGERLERLATAIVASRPPPPPSGGMRDWLQESWTIARDSAYPAGDDPVPTLSAEFNLRAHTIAQRRIAESGYRLAELLKRLLGGNAD